MFIFGRLDDGPAEGLGRSPTDHIMHAFDVSPPFPCRQQARDGVRQTMLVGGYHNTASAAWHTLHVAQHKGRGDRIGLAGASPRHDDGGMGTYQLGKALRGVKVYLFLRCFGHGCYTGWRMGKVWTPRCPHLHTRYPQCQCSLPGISSEAHEYAH